MLNPNLNTRNPLGGTRSPFQGGGTIEGEFSVADTLTKFANGYITGFTTIDVGEAPDNAAENIAHSLGSLLGFIGVVPGLGTVGSALSKGIVATMKASMGAKGFAQVASGLAKASTILPQFTSVPMMSANLVQGAFKKLGGGAAANIAENYLIKKGINKVGVELASDALGAGLHLGVASATSSWRDGTDAMMSSFVHGTWVGAGFRVAGHFLPTKGRDLTKGFFENLGKDMQDPKGIARIISSSIFSGLEASYYDQPTELQIYHYLLGAYFGAREMSMPERKALNWMHKAPRDGVYESALPVEVIQHSLMGYDKPSTSMGKKFLELKASDPQAADIVATQINLLGLKTAEMGQSGKHTTAGGTLIAKIFEKIAPTAVADEATLKESYGSQLFSILNEATIKQMKDDGLIYDQTNPLMREEYSKRFVKGLSDTSLELDMHLQQQKNDIALAQTEATVRASLLTDPEYKSLALAREEMVSDKEIPRGMIRPIEKIVADTYMRKGGKEVGEYLDIQNKVKDAVKKYTRFGEDYESFGKMLGEIESSLNVEIKEGTSTWNALRKNWVTATRVKSYDSLTRVYDPVTKTYTFETLKDGFTIDGKDVTKEGDDVFLNALVGDDIQFLRFDRIQRPVRDEKGVELKNKKDEPIMEWADESIWQTTDPAALVSQLWAEGKVALFGHKASDVIAVRSIKPEEATPEYIKKKSQEFIDAFVEAKIKVAKKEGKVSEGETQSNVTPLESITKTKVERKKVSYKTATKDPKYSEERSGYTLTFPEMPNSKKFFVSKVKGGWVVDAESGISLMSDRFSTMKEAVEAARERLNSGSKDKKNEAIFKELGMEELITKPVKDLKEEYRLAAIKEINNLAAEYSKEFAIINPSSSPDQVKYAMLVNLFHNMDVLVKMNKVDLSTILANPDKFLIDKEAALNKRTTIFSNGFKRVDPTYMGKVAGAENGLNVTIINALNKNGLAMAFGINDYMGDKINKETKLPESYRLDTHVDGIIYLRDDVFDMLQLQGGLDIEAGASKGTLTHTADGLGMLIGKYAYHRAGKELSGDMLTKNQHAIMNTTSAKQYGLREVNDAQWVDGKLQYYKEGTLDVSDPAMYTIPHRDFTYTEGGEHVHSQLKSQLLASQFRSIVNRETFPHASKMIEDLIDDSIKGDAYHNAIYDNFVKDNKHNIEGIDVTKLSITNLTKIMTSGKDSPLYRKVINEYVRNFDAESTAFEDGIIHNEAAQFAKSLRSSLKAADRILDLVDVKPEVLALPSVQAYVFEIFKHAMVKKATTPRLEGSFLSVLGPLRWDLMAEMAKRGGLKEGEMLLGDAMRDYMKFSWKGEYGRVRLEDAIAEYEAAKAANKDVTSMESDLTWLAQRVPTDSASGIRPIRVLGFSKVKGTGSILHPLDMQALGGADLDIDKSFFYTNMPKEVKGEFARYKYQWSEFKTADGKPATSQQYNDYISGNSTEKIFRIVKDAKGSSPFDKGKRERIPNSLRAFSPVDLLTVNKDSYTGAELLGPSISFTKRLAALASMGDITLESVNKETGAKETKTFKTTPESIKEFEFLKYQMINKAADSADGIQLVHRTEAQMVLAEALFGISPDWFPYLTKSKQYNSIRELDGIVNGRGIKKTNLQEVVDMARTAGEYLGSTERGKGITNSPYYDSIVKLGDVEVVSGNDGNFLASNAFKRIKKIQELVNKDKVLLDLIGREFSGINFYNDFRMSETYINKTPFQKYLFGNELIAQSFLDATGAVFTHKMLPKDKNGDILVDKGIVKGVLAKAQEIKDYVNKELNTVKKDWSESEHSNSREVKLRADTMIEAYVNDLRRVAPAYENLFYSYLLSPIAAQFKTQKAFQRDYLLAITDTFRKALETNALQIQKRMRKASVDVPAIYKEYIDNRKAGKFVKNDVTSKLLYKRSLLIEELAAEVKSVPKKAREAWLATNQATWVFESNVIPAKVMKDYLDTYSKLTSDESRTWNKDTVKELGDYFEESAIIGGNVTYPVAKKIHDLHFNFEQMAKATHDELPADVKAKLDKAGTIIEKYYSKYPEKIGDLEAMFAGEIFHQKGHLGVHGTNVVRMATPDQVVQFAETLEKVMTHRQDKFELKPWHYFMNPKTINEKSRYYENSSLESWTVPVKNGDLAEFGEVKIITSTQGKIYDIFSAAEAARTGAQNATRAKLATDPIMVTLQALNRDHDGLGSLLFELAVAEREKNAAGGGGKERDKAKALYEGEYAKVKAKLDELLTDTQKLYEVPLISDTPLTHRDIFQLFKDWQVNHNKEIAVKQYNPQEERNFLSQVTDRHGNIDLDAAATLLIKMSKEGRIPHFGANFAERLTHEQLIQEVELSGQAYLEIMYKKAFKSSKEKPIEFPEDMTMDDLMQMPGYAKLANDFYNGKAVDGLTQTEIEIARLFVKKHEALMKGEVNEDVIGNPTKLNFKLSDIADKDLRSAYLSTLRSGPFNKGGWMTFKDYDIPKWWANYYFPHNDFYENVKKQYFLEKIKEISDDSNGLPTPEKTAQTKENVIKAFEELSNRNTSLESFEDLMGGVSIEPRHVTDYMSSLPSRMERDLTDPVPGWKKGWEAYEKYENDADRYYYTTLGSFLSRRTINKLVENNGMGADSGPWAKFLYLYHRGQVGHPSMLPEAWKNDPRMRLKYNPYMLITDEYWSKKAKDWGVRFFDDKTLFKDLKVDEIKDDLLREKTKHHYRELILHKDNKKLKELAHSLYNTSVASRTAYVSQLEAKFQLITLLSHPKAMIANYASGHSNTLTQTGMRHFMGAGSELYLTQEVFPGAKNLSDVWNIVEKHGGVDNMFFNQYSLDTIKNKRLHEEVVKAVKASIAKDGYNEKNIKEVFKEYGVTDTVMGMAGYFMRTSEVQLRRKSWLAHYLNAREVLSVNGMHLPPEHPWLVHWANKGVETTQFLYNNVNRPLFLQTSLGKIYGRFQLWAWSSLAFRKQVHLQAHRVGYQPGTQEFNNLRRLMTSDLLFLAVGAILPYSFVDNAVAPPMGYMQDLAQWAWGTDEEQKKAFFGALPYPANILQIAAPPVSRFAFAPLTAIIEGKPDALARMVMSGIPFGRLITSTSRSIEDPSAMLDHTLGLPISKLSGAFEGQLRGKKSYNYYDTGELEDVEK